MRRLVLFIAFLTLIAPGYGLAAPTNDILTGGTQYPNDDMTASPGHQGIGKQCPPPTAANPNPGCRPPPLPKDLPVHNMNGPAPVNGASGAPTQSAH